MNNVTFLKPRISVVIPLFNKEKHIVDTLHSVFNQSFKALEIIVVDDGSTDGGPELVKQFNHVRLVRQKNSGVSAARNRGVAEAGGDFVAFIDADDRWLPHFLEEITRLIRDFPAVGLYATSYQFCTGDHQFHDPKLRFRRRVEQPRILDDYFDAGARGDLPFMMSSVVVRRSAFDDIGLFPVGEPMGEDQDFFCRAVINSSIAYSPRVLSLYQLDSSNRACVRNVPEQECPFSLRLRVWGSGIENKKLRRSIQAYCNAHVLHLASQNIRSGRFKSGKKLLGKVLGECNWARKNWWSMRCILGESLQKVS